MRQSLSSATVEKTDRNRVLEDAEARGKSARTEFPSDSSRIVVVHHRGNVMALGWNNSSQGG